MRQEASGRRRYLDALLVGPDGREVGVEIDGAHHMQVAQWDQDLDRGNELAIGGTLTLHFTSLAVRLEPARVAHQIKRALGIA
jgi:very-short-patch-repair endonuclease